MASFRRWDDDDDDDDSVGRWKVKPLDRVMKLDRRRDLVRMKYAIKWFDRDP